MKVCKNCLKSFDEQDERDFSPLYKLGAIFTKCMGDMEINDLCPDCRKKMGMLTLLGFGE